MCGTRVGALASDQAASASAVASSASASSSAPAAASSAAASTPAAAASSAGSAAVPLNWEQDLAAHPSHQQQPQQKAGKVAQQQHQQSKQPAKVPKLASIAGAQQKPQQQQNQTWPVAFWDFKKRVAYRHVSGQLQESAHIWQLRPDAGLKSPVMAQFGEAECRLSSVWWEIVSADVVQPVTPVYRKIQVTSNKKQAAARQKFRQQQQQ
jgi:hypothetical protein